MKKLLTIVLALALVFSVAGSAFAFTGITEEETSTSAGFTVTVDLVDYQYGWKDGIYYKVAAGRAYAINEVVGALVTVVAPAESDEPVSVKITGSNVKIMAIETDVKDANVITPVPANLDTLTNGQISWKTANEEAYLAGNDSTSNKTFKFFVTGQLKSETGGSITAKIVDQQDTIDWDGVGVDVEGASGLKFNVTFDAYEYAITAKEDGEYIDTDDQLLITVKRDYTCKAMYLYDAETDTEYEVVTVNGKIAFRTGSTADYVVSGEDGYSDLLDKLNEMLDEFGFDYNAEGYLYKSFFVALNGSVTVSDTAYVEPALPSSALVADLAVAIPQTGSVSFVGFAMIALAVAAAVAVKKAR